MVPGVVELGGINSLIMSISWRVEMMKMRNGWMGLIAAVAVVGYAGVASAQLNIAELAAGVAIPFKTDSTSLSTEAVLTNGGSADRTVHFDLINGDPAEAWEVQSWVCTLTARETVQITFTNDAAGGSTVTFECDAIEGLVGPPFAGNDGTINSDAEQGVLWATIQNTVGQTIRENILFGDWTLIDTASGEAASAPAAGFQGFTGGNTDKVYVFDGATEYSTFPAVLASNYLPPATYPGQLLVFTLDGVTGVAPQVRARILWYNDDEDFEDDSIDFKCFDVLDYNTIAPGLAALDSAGHMEIIPVTHPGTFPATFDDTRAPLLCYNLQDAPGGGSTLRPCNQSTSAFVKDLTDPNVFPQLDTQL
jgi:hypothetical protein